MNNEQLETISDDMLENVSGGTFGGGCFDLSGLISGAFCLVGGLVEAKLNLIGEVVHGVGHLFEGDDC